MKDFIRRHRAATLVVTVAVAAAVSAVAYAYFAGQGSTTADFNTAGAPSLTVVAEISGGPFYPGDSIPVSVDVTNNSGHASGVGQVTLTGVTGPSGCDSGWFSMSPLPGGGALADGASRHYDGSIAFQDTGNDQSDCESSSLTASIAATP